MRFSRILLATLGAGLLATACQDLDVTNPNNPDRRRALRRPGDVESLIGTQFNTVWGVIMGSTAADAEGFCAMETCPAATLSVTADHFSSSWGNAAMRFVSAEPRGPYNNSSGSSYRAAHEFAWYQLYAAISNANDGISAIEDGLVELGSDAATDRALAFAKLMQGVAHGYLALYYDSAYVHHDTMDAATQEFVLQPYQEVSDEAIRMIREAIAIMDKPSDFTTEQSWVRGLSWSDEQLARFAHSYIARFLAYTPRTPAERDAVDWATVEAEVSAGITADVAPVGSPNIFRAFWKQYAQDPTWTRMDMWTLGPADTAGRFQAWINTPLLDRREFIVATPDRRIVGAGGPTANGTYFTFYEEVPFRASRGTYHFSHYSFARFGGPNEGWETGPLQFMTKAEMDLLKAEAHIQQGELQQAADLINITRVGNGGLPPVTALGVVPGPGCVPRDLLTGASCGDLMDALMYEVLIETAGMEAATAFFNKRGWGLLVPGTFLHFPVPAKERETLGLPIYTYGGGGAGSAP